MKLPNGTPAVIAIADLCMDRQARCTLDNSVVEEYRELRQNGSKPPPITVVDIKGKLWLADGNHRIRAAQLVVPALTEVDAIVIKGNDLDLLLAMALCNRSHGLRLTREDRGRLVDLYLTDHWNLSDDVIANAVGVTDQTVANHRPKFANPDDRRVGLDGLTRHVHRYRGDKPKAGTAPGWIKYRQIPYIAARIERKLAADASELAPILQDIRRALSPLLDSCVQDGQTLLNGDRSRIDQLLAGIKAVITVVAPVRHDELDQLVAPRPSTTQANELPPTPTIADAPPSAASIARRLISGELTTWTASDEQFASAIRTAAHKLGHRISRKKIPSGYEMRLREQSIADVRSAPPKPDATPLLDLL